MEIWLDGIRNEKSINFSCRLQNETFSIIETESKKKGISINSQINKIVTNYVSLGRHSKDLQLISLTNRTIRKIFGDMKDDSIEELSKHVGGIIHRELVLLKYGQITFDNLMTIIEINSSRYGTTHHTFENNTHRFCIHHNSGINFSKFISSTHQIMADELSLQLQITNVDENITCIEIEEP